MKKLLLVFAAGILFTACSFITTNREREVYNYNYAGTLEVLEMSVWQYGTHTLTTETGEFYAVRSEEIDLNEYVGQPVHILGTEIEGYPVDSGPKFIDIEKIQLMEK